MDSAYAKHDEAVIDGVWCTILAGGWGISSSLARADDDPLLVEVTPARSVVWEAVRLESSGGRSPIVAPFTGAREQVADVVIVMTTADTDCG